MASYDEIKAKINAQANASAATRTQAGTNAVYGEINPIEGFVRSAGSAMFEAFGAEPSDFSQAFEKQSPAVAAAGDLTGDMLNYVGVGKLGKIGKLGKWVEGDATATGFAAGAAKASRMFAPYEAGRSIVAAATGDNGADVASGAAVNLAAAVTLGGIGSLFKAAGKVDKVLDDVDPGVDLRSPTQVQMKSLKDLLEKGTLTDEAQQAAAKNKLARMAQAIQNEELPSGKDGLKYVQPLEDGADSRVLDRLFRTGQIGKGAKSGISQQRFAVTSRDFTKSAERDAFLSQAGLKDNLDSVQFPRFLEGKTPEGVAKLEAALTKHAKLKTINDDMLMGREVGGLYVVAKRLREGDRKAWALFKTDDPAKFAPEQSAWMKKIEEKQAWFRDPVYKPNPDMPLEVLDEAATLASSLPMRSFAQANTGRGAKTVEKIFAKFGLEGDNELSKRGREFVREYFAPAMFQFKKSPRAAWIHTVARSTYDKASALSRAVAFGDDVTVKGTNLFGQLLKGASNSGKFGAKRSFKSVLDSLDEEEFGKFVSLTDQMVEGKALDDLFKSGEISENLYKGLQDTIALDDYVVGQIRGIQKATGSKEFQSVKGHYGLSRTWEGDWRVPIYNQDEKLVYMASGKNKLSAEKQAERLVAESKAEGLELKTSKAHLSDTEGDAILAAQVRVGSPEYMTAAGIKAKVLREANSPKTLTELRTGVKGYKTGFTREELLSKYYNNLDYRMKYTAELSTNKLLEDELLRLSVEDPQLFKELTSRLSALSGKQGVVNRQINAGIDRVLGPVLGKNSGTQIAGAINESMHHLNLGMGNLSHPIMNMTTFIQTVMPRVAFLTSATDASLARHFSWLPLQGSDGRPRGATGFMDMMKMMKNSVKEMRKPTADLQKAMTRATSEGIVDPKFIEEYVGQNATTAGKLGDALTGKQPFAGFIKAVSNYLPAQSEKLSRGHAFTVGYMVGRDFFKIQDEALYRFARQFTENTMFNYGVADRARVFSGPLGNVFGLFKNWQTHYIATMLEYTGEGWYRGNWNPLLWQMGGTAALGGAAALPMYGAANKFSEWATDESLMTNIYQSFGGTKEEGWLGSPADAVFHGLPAFLGLSFSGSAAAPLSDPARDASMLFSFVQADRAAALGKAVGASVDAFGVTGEHPIKSEEVKDLFIKALAPKNFARVASITEDNAIKSLNNGNKIVGNLNTAETLMYSMGLTPRRIGLAHEVNEELWKKQDSMRNKVAGFGKAWAEAEREKDWDMLKKIQTDAMIEGVDIGRVIASAKVRKRNQTSDPLDRQFDAKDINEFRALGLVK